ncbi:hypothetical protein ACXIZN_41570 [Amycolatopsis sp. TRM77291]
MTIVDIVDVGRAGALDRCLAEETAVMIRRRSGPNVPPRPETRGRAVAVLRASAS